MTPSEIPTPNDGCYFRCFSPLRLSGFGARLLISLGEEPMGMAIDQQSTIAADREQDPPELHPVIRTSAARFLLEHWLRLLGISACVVVPCFWHRNIEAGDLSSHTYNAWLVQLIQHGHAPGLWLAWQSTNILFDLVLSQMGNLLGLRTAEKIVVAVAILVFYWGAFALVCASARRVPWFVLPCLAMFAYGFTFELGLMNYYVSLGLSFWALAIALCGRGWERALAVALLPLIWMAHPSGVVLVIAAGAYIAVAEMLPSSHQLLLVAISGLVLFFGRFYLIGHYRIFEQERPFYFYNGLDQLLLYGPHYRLPAILLLVVIVGCLASHAIRPPAGVELLAASRLPLQLYVITIVAAQMLPDGIYLPQYTVALSVLPGRLTTISAVLISCVLGVTNSRKWVLVSFATVAAIFFFFLFRDTGTLNRMENQVERYENVLPPGQRVIATIWPFPGARIQNHIVDRPCIGRCFSYGNYEPATRQFRVRALPGNPIVTADSNTSAAMWFGEYVVQPQDLPMFQIYQCKLDMIELCMRELASGETNGKYGLFHLVH